MEDFIILNTGYQMAIKDSLYLLKDLDELVIIQDRLLRMGEKHRLLHERNSYKGSISKYYDKKNDLGYIIFDDINKLKGVMIFVTKKEYKEIDEQELIFVKNTMNPFVTKEFNDEEEIEANYKKLLDDFKLLIS